MKIFPAGNEEQVMKIRAVSCIHVAAYLFSAIVLGSTALSYFYEFGFSWTAKGTNPV